MGFEAFAGHKYLNLETFKKSGEGVKTPVWFAADPASDLASDAARLYAYTIGNSGKVKRIRNNGRVRSRRATWEEKFWASGWKRGRPESHRRGAAAQSSPVHLCLPRPDHQYNPAR